MEPNVVVVSLDGLKKTISKGSLEKCTLIV